MAKGIIVAAPVRTDLVSIVTATVDPIGFKASSSALQRIAYGDTK
jgi:hypothetical protein